MSREVRLGVLGGTFDPLHLGHLRAAESVREAMALDRVLFVPARIPPHKAGPEVAPAEDRYRMIQAGIGTQPAFAVSRIEIERQGPSYTIDTLAELRNSGPPGTELFFVTGVDAFRDIQTWNRWEDLLKSYPFIVHSRPGCRMATAFDALPESMHSMLVEPSGRSSRPPGRGGVVYLIEAVTLGISSTEVRDMVRHGHSIRYLVPAEVEEYIQKHRLYR